MLLLVLKKDDKQLPEVFFSCKCAFDCGPLYTPVKDRNFLHESEKIKMVNGSDCDELRCISRIPEGPQKNETK